MSLNKLHINMGKCCYLHFQPHSVNRPCKDDDDDFEITIHNVAIKKVSQTKFLGMVLFVVILGLAGGNELSYFKYITTQKVANAIMIIGFIIFIFKIIFWYWDKKRENVSE